MTDACRASKKMGITLLCLMCCVLLDAQPLSNTADEASAVLKLNSFDENHSRTKRKIYAFEDHPQRKWSTVIQYYVNRNGTHFTDSDEKLIDDLLQNDFERKTCLKFEKESTLPANQSFLHFTDNNETHHICEGYVGRVTSNGQEILLGENCLLAPHLIVQLVASALGLFGEQQRPDRDQYVEVFEDYVDSNFLHMFEIQHDVDFEHVPYDLGSLMQAAPMEYSKNPSAPIKSILPHDRKMSRLMGQTIGLSYYDIMALNKAYCDKQCPTNVDCQQGYQNPLQCSECLCPDGLTGPLCTSIIPGHCVPVGGLIFASKDTQCLQSSARNMFGYKDGEKCSWIIEGSEGHHLQFWFVNDVSLPYNRVTGACRHWVEIKYNGTTTPRGPRYCGDHYPGQPATENPLVANNKSVMVIFLAEKLFEQEDVLNDLGFTLCFNMTSQNSNVTNQNSSNFNVTNQNSSDSKMTSKNMSMIVIIVLLAVLIVMALLIMLMLCFRKKRSSSQPNNGTLRNIQTNPGFIPPSVVFTPADAEKAKLEKELQEITLVSGFFPTEPPPRYDYDLQSNSKFMSLDVPTYENLAVVETPTDTSPPEQLRAVRSKPQKDVNIDPNVSI